MHAKQFWWAWPLQFQRFCSFSNLVNFSFHNPLYQQKFHNIFYTNLLFFTDEPTYDVAEGIEDAHGHVTQPPPPSRDHAPNHTPTTSKKAPQMMKESLFDDYAVLEENSAELAPSPAPPPQEGDYQLITIRQQPSVDREGLEINIKPEQPIYSNNDIMGEGPIYGNTGIEDCPDYDDPSNLSPPPINPTAAGDYDDPDLILDSAGNLLVLYIYCIIIVLLFFFIC